MTKEQAYSKAEALVACLGSNWKPCVWENLGWHYCARALGGTFTVYPILDGQYCALLGSSLSQTGAGLPLWTDRFAHEDPREVVRHQAALALRKVQHLMEQAKKADAIRIAMENEQQQEKPPVTS